MLYPQTGLHSHRGPIAIYEKSPEGPGTKGVVLSLGSALIYGNVKSNTDLLVGQGRYLPTTYSLTKFKEILCY